MQTRRSFESWPTLFTTLCLLAALACGRADGPDASTSSQTDAAHLSPASVEPLTVDELANATFFGILDQPVQLIDGSWQGEPFVEGGVSAPAVGLVESFRLAGDLTGDGRAETVVLLWSSSGGSGTFDYIAVAGCSDEGIAILGVAELGDRVQVRQGDIVESRIELDVVQAGPEDAACCPTQLATRIWEMSSDGLVERPAEPTGTLSLDLLRGPEWVLTDLAWNESAPAEPEVTVTFEEDRIVGHAGCNRYFGGIEAAGEAPNAVSFGHLGATRMMCPEEVMAIEDRFIRQLSAVSHFSFLAGQLALSWQSDDSGGVMLFSSREPAPAG